MLLEGAHGPLYLALPVFAHDAEGEVHHEVDAEIGRVPYPDTAVLLAIAEHGQNLVRRRAGLEPAAGVAERTALARMRARSNARNIDIPVYVYVYAVYRGCRGDYRQMSAKSRQSF